MNILGLHKDPWHNTGAALIQHKNGDTRFVMISEERLDRVKDSRAFPNKSIQACLAEMQLSSIDELDLVVLDYIHNPDWKSDYVRNPCTQEFLGKIPQHKIRVINHHLAHAYAVFYSSGFDRSAILIVDGRGSDQETQSLYVADSTKISLVATTKKIGIGLLYAAVTQAIGFGLMQEGKTMGLAPFGQPTKEPIFNFKQHFDGIVTDYSYACIEGSYGLKIPHSALQNFEDKAQAAYEVQNECEIALLHLARWSKEVTGLDNLCISGGVGLNSVANYKILHSGIFKEVFVNPAASDTGIPLGAALYGYHQVMKAPRDYDEIPVFIGPSYSAERIQAAIHQLSGYRIITNNVIQETVDLLDQNLIVGCHYGRSEMGPRALGNRSILMSPLKAENKDTLNLRVKHRESFRPFAPAILEEHIQEYFEMDSPCPYMLFVPKVREEKRSMIPAVTHVDGTGRVQTVNQNRNPLFYELITGFAKKTGVPVLLNTSFNDNNEPIVETPEDAIRCFLKTNIDALLIGRDTLLVKETAPK